MKIDLEKVKTYFVKNPVGMFLPYLPYSMPAIYIDTYLAVEYFVYRINKKHILSFQRERKPIDINKYVEIRF